MKINDYYQYLGVIKPNCAVTSDAMDMKIRCKNDHNLISTIYSKPHFTVFDIIQPVLNEKRIIKCFERKAGNILPFQIDLYGFDYFIQSTYTLYVKLHDQQMFSEMAKYIRKFSNPILKSVKDHPPYYNIKNAHLTIAKGISEPEFRNLWHIWGKDQYQSSTVADHLLILRRPFSPVNFKYEIIGEYPFLGKGPLETQMSLF